MGVDVRSQSMSHKPDTIPFQQTTRYGIGGGGFLDSCGWTNASSRASATLPGFRPSGMKDMRYLSTWQRRCQVNT